MCEIVKLKVSYNYDKMEKAQKRIKIKIKQFN